jgi:hypothetical protein
MSPRGYPAQRAASWAACVVFGLLGCLNPRPEELPSDSPTSDLPVVVPTNPPAAIDPGVGSGPGFEGETPDPSPLPADDVDAGDAGAPSDDAGGSVQGGDRGGACQDAGD